MCYTRTSKRLVVPCLGGVSDIGDRSVRIGHERKKGRKEWGEKRQKRLYVKQEKSTRKPQQSSETPVSPTFGTISNITRRRSAIFGRDDWGQSSSNSIGDDEHDAYLGVYDTHPTIYGLIATLIKRRDYCLQRRHSYYNGRSTGHVEKAYIRNAAYADRRPTYSDDYTIKLTTFPPSPTLISDLPTHPVNCITARQPQYHMIYVPHKQLNSRVYSLDAGNSPTHS